MKALAEQLVASLWRSPVPAMLCIAAISLGAAWFARDISVAHSLEVWFDADSAEMARYRDFTERWGNDEIVVISLPAGWEPGMATTEDIVAELDGISGVAQVFSLLDLPAAFSEQGRRFVSTDGEQQLLALQMQSGSQFEIRRHEVLADIRAALAGMAPDAHMSGVGVVYETLNELSTRGAVRLLLACDALLILLLWCFYGRGAPVAITLLCVTLAGLWVLGLLVIMGRQINMVTMILPTVVMVMGTADCVHILRSVARQPTHLMQETRVRRGIARVFTPCLVTTLTTAAGFLALAVAGIPSVRDLGLFAAIGVLLSFVLALLICILALRYRQVEPRTHRWDLASAVALRLAGLGEARPLLVTVLWAALAGLAFFGTRNLAVDTNSFAYLPPDNATSASLRFIENKFGPFLPLEFVVELPAGTREAEAVDLLHDWQLRLSAHPDVGWAWSAASLFPAAGSLRTLALRDGDHEIESTRASYPRLWQNLVDEGRFYRVTAGVPALSAGALKALIEELESSAQFPDGGSAHAAGYLPLYAGLITTLVKGQLQSFAIALGLIIVLLGIFLRDARLGMLAFIANLLPVLLTLGLMGQLGIPVDIATVTIASVVLGLIVDDTVHLLHGLKHAGTTEAPVTVGTTVRETGGALVMTAIVLAGGFGVLGIADLKSIAWFGSLSAFAAGTAVLVDLMLLPALLQLRLPKNRLPHLSVLAGEHDHAGH